MVSRVVCYTSAEEDSDDDISLSIIKDRWMLAQDDAQELTEIADAL